MGQAIVAVDIDDVLIPLADKLYKACEDAGLNRNCKPLTQWKMYKDLGCTMEEWLEVFTSLTVENGIYHQPPYPGVYDAVWNLVKQGHVIHYITARGFHNHREVIREWTKDWLETNRLPGHLWFEQDKGKLAKTLGVTHAIDDGWHNILSYEQAGIEAYLMNQPYNQAVASYPRRVDSFAEFVERIIRNG